MAVAEVCLALPTSEGEPLTAILGDVLKVYDAEAAAVVDCPLDQTLGSAKYVAMVFSASYCPSCRDFTPTLEQLSKRDGALEQKGCKVVLLGGDKTAETYDAYVDEKAAKAGWACVPFAKALELKDKLRQQHGIQTIPHVVLIDRWTGKTVKTNVRFDFEQDASLSDFPWTAEPSSAAELAPEKTATVDWTSASAPFLSEPVFALGHRVKDSEGMYMDEHAVRARAGVLNIFSWIAIMNFYLWQESWIVWVLWPIVCWDMFAASVWGLTPLAPIGVLGTCLARLVQPKPYWKPAKPKRFAWVIGFSLVNICFVGYQCELMWLMEVTVWMCSAATWMESALGFCIGCWVWNNIVVVHFKLKPCEECKL
jgi:thiol-disulfide isomerase/thioredoxin